MPPRPRRPVHACNVCNAIWDGPKPPDACPQCKASGGWTSAEVGDQPGMVGGRVFVAGTDTPMTRTVVCAGCGKLSVARRGEALPETCPKCGGGAFNEAFRPGVAKAPAPPPPPPTIPTATVGGHAAREKAQDAANRAALALDEEQDRQDARDLKELPFVPETITVEQYRNDWIAERVAAWAVRGLPDVLPPPKPLIDLSLAPPTEEPAAVVWRAAASLYDAGRKGGYLP